MLDKLAHIATHPLVLTLLPFVLGMIVMMAGYLWKQRKPKLSIEVFLSEVDDEIGLTFEIKNFSDRTVRIGHIGYDIFGDGDEENCFILLDNITLMPQSLYEKFIEDKELDPDELEKASILFLKDQIGHKWRASKVQIKTINNYKQFKNEHVIKQWLANDKLKAANKSKKLVSKKSHKD